MHPAILKPDITVHHSQLLQDYPHPSFCHDCNSHLRSPFRFFQMQVRFLRTLQLGRLMTKNAKHITESVNLHCYLAAPCRCESSPIRREGFRNRWSNNSGIFHQHRIIGHLVTCWNTQHVCVHTQESSQG